MSLTTRVDRPTMGREGVRAVGIYVATILTGIAVYDTPPESLAVFWQWVWQPNLQGMQMALGSLGISAGIGAVRKN